MNGGQKHMTEYERMLDLLEMSWSMRSQIVPCLVGPPGIGKTAAVREHASNHGSKVVKIVASRCVPSETVGMTMPDNEHRSMTIYNSQQLSSLRDGDILFLDELLEAEQYVLSTLLTVIESREMADGTPLPDVQIIAATNDTVPPEHLKGNIRQRFVFDRFGLDKEGTRQYIKDLTDMDVPSSLLSMLCAEGSDYNFMTPRSLTKMFLWMDSADNESDAKRIAMIIDRIWRASVGTTIYEAWLARAKRDDTPEAQFRRAVKDMVPSEVAEKFEECSLVEMYEMLSNMPEWDVICDKLSRMDIMEREDGEEIDVQF